ncbi:hypothetical protein BH10PLA2_BH10PLA2_06750 [soil metagenome]
MSSILPDASVRRSIYMLLITVAAGLAGGRILGVARVYEPYYYRDPAQPNDTRGPWKAVRPDPSATHGDNDRSRWDTIRALVENGTYAIGKREFTGPDPEKDFKDSGICFQDGWVTIDKILHPETHEFYSSKPPLLPTILAGEYWLIQRGLGWSFDDQNKRFWIVRTMLFSINWLPFVLSLIVFSRMIERVGVTDWGRMYGMASACFGTLVMAFNISLNNHTIAFWMSIFALAPALSILLDGRRDAWLFAVSGLFSGLMATTELPAASLMALLFVLLLWQAPGRTLGLFLPAMLIPLGAFFLTNYLALGEWKPAYEKFGTPWYEYAGSHWRVQAGEVKSGIDFDYMRESKLMYTFHLLVGHHGLFLLSPIFLLSLPGIAICLFGKDEKSRQLRLLGGIALLVSVVVIGFYIVGVDPRNRNYGGWSVGPRWLIWLAPLLILSLVPMADWCSRRTWSRTMGYIFLALSVFSANISWNPWRPPWIFRLLEELGWISS